MGVQRSEMLRDELAKVDRVEQLREWKQTGEKFVSDATLAEAERVAGWAVQNAELRVKQAAEREATAAAQAAAVKAKAEQRAQAEQDAYLARRRAQFRGTDTQWEQLKPRILEDYLLGDEATGWQPAIRF